MTLLHGDLWIVNVGMSESRVTLFDWGVATHGPPVIDFVTFLAGCASHVDASRDRLLEDIRTACGGHHDEQVLQLALFWGLAELGWNKALDSVDHPDAAKRARERSELGWWVDRAIHVIDEGLLG